MDLLIKAIEYVEGSDSTSETRENSTVATPNRRSNQGHRNSVEKNKHTEVEKKRRAYMRECLESLKNVVPPDRDTHKLTIHRLLIKSKEYIKTLERRHIEYQRQYSIIEHRNINLKGILAELEKNYYIYQKNSELSCSEQLSNGDHLEENNKMPVKVEKPPSISNLFPQQPCEEPPQKKAADLSVKIVKPFHTKAFTTVLPGPDNRVTIRIHKRDKKTIGVSLSTSGISKFSTN